MIFKFVIGIGLQKNEREEIDNVMREILCKGMVKPSMSVQIIVMGDMIMLYVFGYSVSSICYERGVSDPILIPDSLLPTLPSVHLRIDSIRWGTLVIPLSAQEPLGSAVACKNFLWWKYLFLKILEMKRSILFSILQVKVPRWPYWRIWHDGFVIHLEIWVGFTCFLPSVLFVY